MTKLANGLRPLTNKELEKVTVEHSTGDTKTSSTNVSNLQGEEWKKRVIQYSEPLRVFEQVAVVNEDLVNSGDKTVHIPKATSHLSLSTSQANVGEGSGRVYTQLDNMNTVDITVDKSNFRKGGIAISKETAMTTSVDYIKQARYAIAQEMADDVDTAIRDAISDNVSTTSPDMKVESSGTLTPDAIAEAMKVIEQQNFVPKWLFITPSQQYDLRTDSQFTNASEYGSNEVVLNGEIGSYLGVKVLVSSNVSSNTALMVGTNRNGEKVGPVIAWKEKPHIDYVYDKDEAEHRIFYDQAFNTAVIHPNSMAKIDTS